MTILHPLVAYRDCEHCKKWVYNEKTGKVETKYGKDVPRKPEVPPCDIKHVGCAKGHYNDQKTLNARNMMAYGHYLECSAVGQFPDDAVVRYNARQIRQCEDMAERIERIQNLGQLSALMGAMGVRRG